MVAAHITDAAEQREHRGVYQSAEVWNKAFHLFCAERVMTDGLEILAGRWYQRESGWLAGFSSVRCSSPQLCCLSSGVGLLASVMNSSWCSGGWRTYCLCGLTPVSSHSPNICPLGRLEPLKWWKCVSECVCWTGVYSCRSQ